MDLLKRLASLLQQQQQAQGAEGGQQAQAAGGGEAGQQNIQKALEDLIAEAKRNPKGLAGALAQNPQLNQMLSQALASANTGQGAGGATAT